MVEMVINELIPALSPLNQQWLRLGENNSQKLEQAKQQIATLLTFLEQLLGKQHYFGKEHLTLAEVIAGTVVSILPFLEVSLSEYPQLNAWIERLNQRPAWVRTQASLKEIEAVKPDIAVCMAARMAAQSS